MSETSKYIVSLTPQGKYFFGGDMTFKVGAKTEYNERYGSYVIQSNLFPQQTSLLGMMRFLLLSNSKEAFCFETKKIISSDKARELIGSNGFTITENCVDNDFQMIKNISPCFLEMLGDDKKWKPLLPAPNDYGYSISFNDSVKTTFNGKHGDIPIVTGYDPKKCSEKMFIFENELIKMSDIFLEDTRIGIDKRYDGKTQKDDSSYYKQICYRLGGKQGRKIRFVFGIEIDKSIHLDTTPYQHAIVNVGGDSSLFTLEARRQVDETLISYPEHYNEKNLFASDFKVILLSDSYLLRSEAENVQFAITDTIPFRFLRTTVNTKDYTILSSENLRSNDKFYLYKKGSVFFCNVSQLAMLEVALTKDCFRQIGYNYYQIIKK